MVCRLGEASCSDLLSEHDVSGMSSMIELGAQTHLLAMPLRLATISHLQHGAEWDAGRLRCLLLHTTANNCCYSSFLSGFRPTDAVTQWRQP